MGRSKQRSRGNTGDSAAVWWTVGGPCAVAIAMLLLGAVLRAPANGAQSIDAESERNQTPIDFVARATKDAERLSADRSAWTLQFLMACERENLAPFVVALSDQPNFFLLPYTEDGRDCYRVCWGRFSSKAEAERPRAYPDALREVKAIRWARPVESVLP